MRRALPHLTALLCGVAAALALGCGSRSHLLPPTDAAAIKDQLAQVRQAVAAGDCSGAQDALNRARAAALNLPANVDRRLRARINEGIKQLRRDVPVDCAAATTPATTTTTTPADTTTTETQTTETTPSTVPTETTTAPPADTTTQPAPTVPTPTTPTDTVPADTGGTAPAGPQP